MGSTPPPPFDVVPQPDGNAALTLHTTTNGQGTAAKMPLTSRILRGLWRIFTLNAKITTGCCIVGFFILLAIFGPLLTRYDPNALTTDILLPPSGQHWLGTTQAGQDVFSQIMIGTRYSIVWGLITGCMVAILYITIGLAAGYFGGIVDEILSLITNIFLVIPGLPLALIIAAYVPYKGPLTVAIAITLTGWPGHARIIRAQTLTIRQRDFVEAANASGLSSWRIIFSEVFPNMIAIVAAGFVGTALAAILAAAGLEFLGLGDIRSVSWGSMFYWAQNNSALIQGAWWWFAPPGICIALLAAGLTFINLGLDEVADPRLRNEGKRFRLRRKQVENIKNKQATR
ncbi:MAG TPA: ABC transporter permease [Ktedonobacteraceae bacterium]|jgi:peptide/nickel transport system permease protein|nr:ABC transporter permease [Ktedonobacteraceae bacterium]